MSVITDYPSLFNMSKIMDFFESSKMEQYNLEHCNVDHCKVDHCKVDYINNLNLNTLKQCRAGVIVYTIYKSKMYFILGIDTESGNITDFGGGISMKRENALTGGLREFSEETLGVFGNVDVEEIKNCVAVYDSKNIIIFLPFDVNIQSKYTEFLKRVKQVKNPEVKDLSILNKRQFLSLIEGKDIDGTTMYDKIRKLLYSGKEKNLMRYL